MTRFISALLFVFFMAPGPAHAMASDWQQDDVVKVRLISDVNGVGQDTTVSLGLEVQMAPEWHTYWRSPGAAGLPPQIDWTNSQSDTGNFNSAALLYPAPKRYTAYGLETIGYKDHVVFPIDAKLRMPGKPLNVDATLDLLVCSAICVPKNFHLQLMIPTGAAAESPEAALIKQFRDQIPGGVDTSGLVLKSITNDGHSLTIDFESNFPLTNPDIFIENDRNISFAAPATTLGANNLSVRFVVKPADTLPDGTTLAGMPLTLSVINGDYALEQHVIAPTVTAAVQATPIEAPSLPLGLAMLFAILGGLILNLMPCVLPVLSLKLLGVVSHGGRDIRVVRHSFLVTAAGIVFSFLVLAAVTLLLRSLGLAFGWGVQFQQPMFLVFLILLLTFFAANMWGLLEIHMPRFFADNLDKDYHPKLAGDFATGAFATLLATPCSAPFLGTAIGFALIAGAQTIFLIFLALGFGMALPYLAIAIWPRFATTLPKPGAWMTKLRHLLGWALGLTALWMLWVLAAQIPWRLAVFVGLSMAGIILLLALRKTEVSRKLVRIGLIDFVAVAVLVTFAGSWTPKPVAVNVDPLWLPFDRAAIAADVEEGKMVFVDVTADWCLTCKANMKFVLTRDPVAQRLFHDDVVAMQANWTSPDPAITDFLHQHGRFGIPFNIVFGPGAPNGLVLPELLTPKAVMDGLDKASKTAEP